MSQLLQSSKIIGDLVDGVDATGVQLAVKFQDLVQEGATIPPDKVRTRQFNLQYFLVCLLSPKLHPCLPNGLGTPPINFDARSLQASSRPEVTFSGADPCALYTLITSDPDPPSPTNPIYKEWLHCVLQLMHIA